MQTHIQSMYACMLVCMRVCTCVCVCTCYIVKTCTNLVLRYIVSKGFDSMYKYIHSILYI